MKKNYFIWLIFTLIVLTLVLCTVAIVFNNNKRVSVHNNWKESQSTYSDSVVCSLKISAITEFEKNHISGKVNIENEPMTLTLINIDTDTPEMVGNLGDKVSLTKIDNGSTVYLIEETSVGNLNIFTLFRDKNIMIMSKQYDMFGTPFGIMMMGDCLSDV